MLSDLFVLVVLLVAVLLIGLSVRDVVGHGHSETSVNKPPYDAHNQEAVPQWIWCVAITIPIAIMLFLW